MLGYEYVGAGRANCDNSLEHQTKNLDFRTQS